MAIFQKVSARELTRFRLTITPMRRDDGTIAGRLAGVGFSSAGIAPVTTAPNDPDIEQAIIDADRFAGPIGTVGVYDPEGLWPAGWLVVE